MVAKRQTPFFRAVRTTYKSTHAHTCTPCSKAQGPLPASRDGHSNSVDYTGRCGSQPDDTAIDTACALGPPVCLVWRWRRVGRSGKCKWGMGVAAGGVLFHTSYFSPHRCRSSLSGPHLPMPRAGSCTSSCRGMPGYSSARWPPRRGPPPAFSLPVQLSERLSYMHVPAARDEEIMVYGCIMCWPMEPIIRWRRWPLTPHCS